MKQPKSRSKHRMKNTLIPCLMLAISFAGLHSANADSASFTRLYSFGAGTNATGSHPVGYAIEGSDGALYGTAGGISNVASGVSAFIGGGGNDGSSTLGNTASGAASAIPGGTQNMASGSRSTVGGGHNNSAKATYDGAFVWNDNSSGDLVSTNANSVSMRAAGGYRLYTGSSSGVWMASGGTSWSTISDRNAKKNFAAVDGGAVLDKLASVPVQQWNYNWEADTNTPNIGPMAQDFIAAFYPGRNDTAITTLEFDGVELAAIQGLHQKLESEKRTLQTQIEKLATENAELKTRLEQLEKAIAKKLN